MKKKYTFILGILLASAVAIQAQTIIGSTITGDTTGDRFGTAVTMTSDGSFVAVGAKNNDVNGGNSGSVKVLQYSGGNWVQVGANINGENAGGESGSSVSLSDDGKIVAIGSPKNDDGGTQAGQVRIYKYQGGNWVQMGADFEGTGNYESLGWSVDLSSDGSKLVIGAIGTSSATGQVKVYEFNGSSWGQLGADLNGEASQDSFGRSVALSNNGTYLVVGADENGALGVKKGHARVFRYSIGSWVQVGADIDGVITNDKLGSSVAISDNGMRVALGAPGTSKGKVRVFTNNANNWVQVGSDIIGETNDKIGGSVAISSSGNRVVVGAPESGNFDMGLARIYDYNADWAQMGTDIIGISTGGNLGNSVAVSSDGNKMVIGDPGKYPSGETKVYNISGLLGVADFLLLRETLRMYPNPTSGDLFIDGENLGRSEIIVTDILGNIISKHSHINKIDFSHLNTGIYFVKIITADGELVKRIIKN